MQRESFDDETLMAYADGETDPSTSLAIEQAMRTDAQLAARVKLFRDTSVMAKQAMDEMLNAKVPASLEASVREAIRRTSANGASKGQPNPQPLREVPPPLIDQAPTTQRTDRDIRSVAQPSWFAKALGVANVGRFAMAASVGAFAIGFLGYLVGSSQTQTSDLAATQRGIAITASAKERGAFATAMSNASSGTSVSLGENEPSSTLEVVATFRDRGDALCREFRVKRPNEATTGVACKSNGEWAVTFAAASPASGSDYAPASSEATLDAYLTSIQAGQPLSLEEEKEALGAAQ